MNNKKENTFGLLPFQEKTVEHICEYFNDHDVYLLADETGLGKTVIASEVIQRLCKNEKGELLNKRVIYIASNLELAESNVENKLKFDGAEVINGRLSMLWKKLEKKLDDSENVKLFALTPEVSLMQKTQGTEEERCQCSNKYRNLKEQNQMLEMEGAKSLSDRIEVLNTALKNIQVEYKSGCYHLSALFWRAVKGKWRRFAFDSENTSFFSDIILSGDPEKDYETAIKLMLECELREYVVDRIWGKNEVEIPMLLQLKSVLDGAEKWSEKSTLICANQYFQRLWKKDNNNQIYLANGEKEKDYICEICHSLDSQEIRKEVKQNSILNNQINQLLREIYCKEYFEGVRTYMSLYSLVKFVDPDIVIIDEIQNYPEIFSEKVVISNERSELIRLVIDTVLNKTSENKDRHQKVLMLSATPYAYHNAIDVETDDSDDPEVFTKNLVGMDEILTYMKNKNNVDIDVKSLWKDCQCCLQKLLNETKTLVNNTPMYQKAQYALMKLRDGMLDLGISRTERPLKRFAPSDSNPWIQLSCAEDFAELTDLYRNGKNAVWNRLALSLPRRYDTECLGKYYSGIGNAEHITSSRGRDLTKRTKMFFQDLFEGDSFLYLFMPPNNPSKELKGIYEGRERKYGKTLVFSAFNAVPAFLGEEIRREWEERIDERFREKFCQGLSVNEAKNKFDSFLESIKAEPKDYLEAKEINKGGEDTIRGAKDLHPMDREVLCEIFSSEYAKRIIICLYGGAACEDYWRYVDRYCEDGNFGAVLDEFAYLRSRLKSRPGVAEYLSKDGKALEEVREGKFAVTFSSKEPDNLQEKLRIYNSPFYPFCFVLTSVAEEGHDFHFYADRIVHWNAPISPIALVQREGRVDRCDCMAIRKEMAEVISEKGMKINKWEELIEKYKEIKAESIEEKYKDMFPRFIASNEGTRIKRYCYYYKYSGEYFRWVVLMRNLEYYRSMFGACDHSMLTEKGRDDIQNNSEKWQNIKNLVLDLSIK